MVITFCAIILIERTLINCKGIFIEKEIVMSKTEMVKYGANVLKWGESLYNKIFYGAEKEVGKTIKVWAFEGRPIHAKQVLNLTKTPDKTVKTITTCYAGAKIGQKPLVRETLTTLRDGTQRADIFYVNGSDVLRASGLPSDPKVQSVCRSVYGLNPDAKSMLWGRF